MGYELPQVDARIVAGFRIVLSTLVALDAAVYLVHFELLFSERGPMPLAVARQIPDPEAVSIFHLLPARDAVVSTVLVLLLVQALLMLVGIAARLQAACIFVWLVSLQARNDLIVDAEDAVIRLFVFLAIFMPLSATWSWQARQRRRAGRSSARPMSAPVSGWALRLVQIQTAVIVLSSALEKLRGRE